MTEAAADPEPSEPNRRPGSRAGRFRGVHPHRLRERFPSSEDLRRFRHRWHRVLVLATLTGVLVGLAVAAFEQVVGRWLLEWTLELPAAVQVVAPGLGVLGAWVTLRCLGRGASSNAADEYLVAYHERDGDIPLSDFPARTMAAASTLGLGGAMGFEGPSIYLGATIGSALRRRFPQSFETADRRLLLVAGAAAGVAAIFKAPATGAVFALEVPYRDDSASHAAVPAIVAAAASYVTFVVCFGLERLFPIVGERPPLDARDLLGALAMGVLAGFGARTFAWALRRAKSVSSAAAPWVRITGAGLALAVVAGSTLLVYDEPLSIGPGFNAVAWAGRAPRSLTLVLCLLGIRALATCLVVAGGGVGGLFIPLFVEGWILGTAVEVVVSSDTPLFPVIGAAAFLGAGYRTPIAAVVFVAESTGRPGFVVPALLATAVAQLAMGDRSVTTSQLRRRLDRIERVGGRGVLEAVVAVPQCAPDARLAEVFAAAGAQARDVVAVVDDGRFVGLVDAVRAGTLLARGAVDALARDALVPDLTVGDPAWTVSQARDALGAGGRYVPIVGDGRFLGLVTAASVLALEGDLR